MGLAGGLVGAVVLRGVIASQLYGVGALDPMVMVAAIGILGATSLVACVGPARRAARVNPWWRCRSSSSQHGGVRTGRKRPN